MVYYLGLVLTLAACKDAAGIAGNIFAFGLFLSPVPTFQRIIRNESTEQFSGLPYIYALLNCLVTAWYGLPMISTDNLLVTTVNSIGAVFQLVYMLIFIKYAEKSQKVLVGNSTLVQYQWPHTAFSHWIVLLPNPMAKRGLAPLWRMIGLLSLVLFVFSIIALGSLLIPDFETRHLTVGFISCASLISMFASPLFIINLVIRTRSVEFMPFNLSLSTFLLSTSFLLYGIFNFDPFVYVPNGIGTILAVIQLVLFTYYKKSSIEDFREPLIVTYA